MSLFGTSKKISVASTAYNLAGTEDARPNFAKTAIIAAVMGTSDDTLGEQITNAYLNGPAIKIRNYGDWAVNTGYDTAIGETQSSFALSAPIDQTTLAGLLPHTDDETVNIQTAEIGGPDYTWWADQYMVANHPTLLNTAYTTAYDPVTNLVTVTLADTSVETFTPTGFDSSKQYLFATYTLSTGEVSGSVTTGSVLTAATHDDFPSTTGWTSDSMTPSSGSMTLDTVVNVLNSYSDHRDDDSSSSTSSTTGTYTNETDVWELTTYTGLGMDGAIHATHQVMTQWSTSAKVTNSSSATTTSTISGGVTKTTVTTTLTDSIVMGFTYRIDTNDITYTTWSALQFLIYAQGSGSTSYDAFFGTATSAGYFLPFIPVRILGSFLSGTFLPDLYPLAQKAYKKVTGAKFDDLVTKISDNGSLANINYAYVVLGVSLNVQENACKEYIYKFFQQITEGLTLSDTVYQVWVTAWTTANNSVATWTAWYVAQSDPTNILYNTTEPTKLPYPTPPEYALTIDTADDIALNYSIRISWNGILETTGTGLNRAGANAGDLWFETITSTTNTATSYIGSFGGNINYDISTDHIRLSWQDSATTWRSLDIYGLAHQNFIYQGNDVLITAIDALADTSESGFIVPLNEDIYKRTSLVKSTQMATACCFLVFNSYTVTTAPWYTSGFFQVILVVAAIVLTVGTAGLGGVGLLGSSAALGASLGFEGLAASIVGAVANAIAAVLLIQIIQIGSTALFGSKIGAIIGAIAGILALEVGTALVNGASSITAFEQLMKVDNLLRLTDALGKGISNYMMVDAQDTIKKTQQVISDYKTQDDAISAKYDDTIGYDTGLIDTLSLVDVKPPTVVVPSEMPQDFFDRTLMVGSDIADLSMSMVNNYTDIMLNRDVVLS